MARSRCHLIRLSAFSVTLGEAREDIEIELAKESSPAWILLNLHQTEFAVSERRLQGSFILGSSDHVIAFVALG